MAKKLPDNIAERYTKHLPEHLQERYEKGLQDSHLLHLRQEIGIVDIHIQMLLENLDRQVLETDEIAKDLLEEFPEMSSTLADKVAERVRTWMPEHFVDYRTFKRLDSLVEQYENNLASRQIRKADNSLKLLFRMIREGRNAGDVWEDIHKSMGQRKSLVDQEQKRLVQSAQLIAVDKVVMLLQLTIESLRISVEQYVQDTEIRDYILVEAERTYSKLLSGSGDSTSYSVDMD